MGGMGGAACPFLYNFVTEIRPQNITLVYFLRLTSLCSSLVTEFFEIAGVRHSRAARLE